MRMFFILILLLAGPVNADPARTGTLTVPANKAAVPATSDKAAAAPIIKLAPKTGTLRAPVQSAPPVTVPHISATAAKSTLNRKADHSAGGKKTIVLDAGHGGQDPGAIGTGGEHEKDITLAVARAVGAALQQSGKYNVIYTRADDTFIPLGTRVKIARTRNADLFVSLHADIAPDDDSARGASIYTISDQASDALSARLAAHENKADLLGPALPDTVNKEVGDILVDFMTHETMGESKDLSAAILKSFSARGIHTIAHPQRAAGFAVLKAPDIPSVLIEMGFLSSDDEVRQLTSPRYQQQLAQSIAAGVSRYFAQDN